MSGSGFGEGQAMISEPRAPGLIVAAPRSGAGKTTIALGLMSALKQRGLVVQPFKCGPDYIDPAFHQAATGRASFNLDTWAMRAGLIEGLIGRAAADADICVAEGVMGVFDGAPEHGRCGRGATADLAALTGWPVVLVLDVSAQAETAAAIALGCRAYRDDIRFAGVILNRVASTGHEALIRPAIERIGLPVLGSVFRRGKLAIPDRHLGLVQASEFDGLQALFAALSEAVAAEVSLDEVIARAKPDVLPRTIAGAAKPPLDPPLSASRWRRTAPFHLLIRISCRAGRRRAQRSFRFRPWPMSRPMRRRARSGCQAAILSFMPARLLNAAVSARGSKRPLSVAQSCMGNAGATWRSGPGWRMPTAFAIGWPVCLGSKRAWPSASSISVIAGRGSLQTAR